MFKTVTNELWAFDSEWTPDPVAGRRLYHLPDEMSDREVVPRAVSFRQARVNLDF
jgi:hypothetical protein